MQEETVNKKTQITALSRVNLMDYVAYLARR